MLKKIVLVGALALTAVLSGCASEPTKEEWAAANYGGPVMSADQLAAGWRYFVQTALIDPDSAKLQMITGGRVERTAIYKNNLPDAIKAKFNVSGNWLYVRTSDAIVNAKNRMGGYTGGIKTKLAFYGATPIGYQEFTEGSWRPWMFF